MAIRGMLREGFFYEQHGEPVDGSSLAHLSSLCPACNYEHSFRVDLTGHGKWNSEGSNAAWTFDGNYEAPTFGPSMLHHANPKKGHPRCHSYVENGHWRFLGDCEHEMAGQTVPMVPPDPDMTWKQRHGWPETT